MIFSITRIEILSVARFQSRVGGSEDTAILKTLLSLSLLPGLHEKVKITGNKRDKNIINRVFKYFKNICREDIILH